MRNDQNNRSRRRAVGWLIALLVLIALVFAGLHLLSGVDFSSLHGG